MERRKRGGVGEAFLLLRDGKQGEIGVDQRGIQGPCLHSCFPGLPTELPCQRHTSYSSVAEQHVAGCHSY